MELIKKIIVSILVIAGIAIAGVIICAGVLIVFPDTKIFGISYMSTTVNDPEQALVSEINISNLRTAKDGEKAEEITGYTIEIDAGNYDVELLVKDEGEEQIYTEFKSNVKGFVKELDSNKKAKLSYTNDDTNKKIKFTVEEPNGLFFVRDTVLTIKIPRSFLNKNIDIISTTNKGITYFGESGKEITVHNATVSCQSAKGGVDLEYAQISGDLDIKNILGRINVKNEIKGKVTIDSTIGTYTFGKVNELVVVAGDDGRTNNPSITLSECNSVKWTSDSGSLKVTNCILDDIQVDTDSANFDIARTIKKVDIAGKSSDVHIGQVGSFETDSTTVYNSFDWVNSPTSTMEVVTVDAGSGNITIDRSYCKLSLTTTKGKISVKNAMREVVAGTKTGSISVDFIDTSSTLNEELDENKKPTTAEGTLNQFINNNFITYLASENSIKSLEINTESGVVIVNNIVNSVDIVAQSSPITLNYKRVKNASNISTSSKAVTIKAPISDFKLVTKMDKNSSAKLEIEFGALVMNSYDDEIPDTTRMNKYYDDEYKYLNVLVGNASNSTNDVITVTNTTGKISAKFC